MSHAPLATCGHFPTLLPSGQFRLLVMSSMILKYLYQGLPVLIMFSVVVKSVTGHFYHLKNASVLFNDALNNRQASRVFGWQPELSKPVLCRTCRIFYCSGGMPGAHKKGMSEMFRELGLLGEAA